MKENFLEVLMYLLENEIDEEVLLNDDDDLLKMELVKAGFSRSEIGKAFEWLEGLVEQQNVISVSNHQGMAAIRVYHTEECEKLDVECRGFLLFLEQIGVLDVTSRELVIDRAMALESDIFDLEQLKWVVLMVLFNRPGQEEAFAWMENLVSDENSHHVH
jgi:Smg protein